MSRALVLPVLLLGLSGSALAQSDMKATAAKKMTSPEQARQMRECEQRAARQNIAMDERSKFVMDCMTAKK